MYPIIDLHCDLLGSIIQDESLHFDSPETNCSLSQLKAGNVQLQTLAIFTVTKKGSSKEALRQLELYQTLKDPHLNFLLSIENGSCLIEEEEPLEVAFERFHRFFQAGKILYLSLTWNDENRFGGGNSTAIGLKSDGRIFLEFLSQFPVAIDLSHTSDALAYDILEWIHRKGLSLKPIASHSNFRAKLQAARNLPDALAKEIIHLNGLIGLNFVRQFVGEQKEDFIKHLEHALYLQGENAICLGADFFSTALSKLTPPIFFPEFSNSSCYPSFQKMIASYFSDQILRKLTHENAKNFLCLEKSAIA